MIIKKSSIKGIITVLFFGCFHLTEGQVSNETNLAGVFQGKTLFIQNSYDKRDNQFCIQGIQVNERTIDLNYNVSAIRLDFEGFDMFSPVRIKILHKDSICITTIINPEAILFHTIFRFITISLTDTALVWTTKGERGIGEFEVEKLEDGIWTNEGFVEANGIYEGCEYIHYPDMEEGANKYRIKYNFPAKSRQQFIYSQEVEYDFYPDPVEFTPKTVKTKLSLSRAAHFEIYDAGGNLILQGLGTEIDVSLLKKGRYIIYFNHKDPGTFIKE